MKVVNVENAIGWGLAALVWVIAIGLALGGILVLIAWINGGC